MSPFEILLLINYSPYFINLPDLVTLLAVYLMLFWWLPPGKAAQWAAEKIKKALKTLHDKLINTNINISDLVYLLSRSFQTTAALTVTNTSSVSLMRTPSLWNLHDKKNNMLQMKSTHLVQRNLALSAKCNGCEFLLILRYIWFQL